MKKIHHTHADVAEILEKTLDLKNKQLAREFQEASQDFERTSEIELWDTLSGDGLFLYKTPKY